MKLHEAVTQYVTYKQSLGMRFATEARTLKSFCRSQAGQELAQITAKAIETFIAGHGPPTRFCLRKHEALHGFYRFAISRLCRAFSTAQERAEDPRLLYPLYLLACRTEAVARGHGRML
jgi:hypothetical protein